VSGLTLRRGLSQRWVELAGANLPIFLLADLPPVAILGREKRGSLDRDVQVEECGRLANMADPFGNGFDLIEFSGAGYDILSQ
jgi:hypothetical protein